MLKLPGCSAELVQSVFSLLISIAELNHANTKSFIKKFANSGGIALCVELKQW